MFERINQSFFKKGDKVRAITVKAIVNTESGQWKVADVQLQEGSVTTEYTEHIAELERVGG